MCGKIYANIDDGYENDEEDDSNYSTPMNKDTENSNKKFEKALQDQASQKLLTFNKEHDATKGDKFYFNS